MKVKIGKLDASLRPMGNDLNFERMDGLFKQRKQVVQKWNCRTQKSDPAKPERKLDVQTNLLFMGYDISGKANRTLGNALIARFFKASGHTSGTALNEELQTKFGRKKDVEISYDALLLSDKHLSKVLMSYAVYAHLFVEFPGRKAYEEVILSVPTFVFHDLRITHECTEDGVRPFEPLFPDTDRKVKRDTIKPLPKTGTVAVKLAYKHKISSAKQRELKIFKDIYEEELRELTGQ